MVDSTWKITQGNPGLPWVITIFCNGGFHLRRFLNCRVTIWKMSWKSSGYHNPEISQLLGNNTRMWNNFQVSFLKKFIFLSFTTFKTEYIYKISYGWLLRLGFWFEVKKMGSSMDHFLNFRVSLPVSQKYFREYLYENANILGFDSRNNKLLIHEKNQTSKISC